MLPLQAMMFQRIATLTSVNISDIYASSNHHFAEVLTPPEHSIELIEITSGMLVPLFTYALVAKQLRPAHAGQFCPDCLKEAAYHRLVWMPIAVSACLEHSCLLLDRCQQCDKKVSILEIVEMRCRKCKSNLTEAGVLPLDNDAGLAYQRVIQSWLLNNTMLSNATHLSPEGQPRVLYRVLDGLQWATRMLAWAEWSYLHRINGDFDMAILQPGKGQNRITPYESYRLYTTAFRGITNWPEGFYEFLRAYRMQQQSGKLLSGGPKADLGNLYTQWLQDYWQHPAFEFVHKAFEHYFIATYSLSSAVARTNLCQGIPGIAEQLSGVSIAEAARLLEVTPKMIDILLRTGKLTLQFSNSTGKQKHRFVNRVEVLELRGQWNELVNRAEAAEWLGISKRMIIDLVKVGLLVVERNPGEGFPHWAFNKSALVDCMEKVLNCVESCSPDKIGEKDSFVDLPGAARLLFVLGLNAASILSYVAEGKLQAYYRVDQDLKLGLLLFDRSDIQQSIQAIKSENGWINREDVTELLKVKDITLARWVKFGLISPAAVCGSAQYFVRESVEKFVADHIKTEEAANLLGVSKLIVQMWARQGKLTEACVSGPNVDGYHAYIFNKEKLSHWHRDQTKKLRED